MAEEFTTQAPPQQPYQHAPASAPVPAPQSAQGCPGDCKNCTREQQTYCAAQIGYYTCKYLTELSRELRELKSVVSGMLKTPEPTALVDAPLPDDENNKKKKR